MRFDLCDLVEGVKYDDGKPRAALVLGAFSNALTEIARVGTFGAQKYTENGWLRVPNGIARYEDAAMRHLLALNRGELLDAESRLPHEAHYAWNVLAALELRLRSSNE